jgi:hypothetical protein
MRAFTGLDVSLRMTAICAVDPGGTIIWEGKAKSEPLALGAVRDKRCGDIEMIGIEACPLSE